jgi:hypothetical protein
LALDGMEKLRWLRAVQARREAGQGPPLRLRTVSRPDPRWTSTRSPLPDTELRLSDTPRASDVSGERLARRRDRGQQVPTDTLHSRASFRRREYLPADGKAQLPGVPTCYREEEAGRTGLTKGCVLESEGSTGGVPASFPPPSSSPRPVCPLPGRGHEQTGIVG